MKEILNEDLKIGKKIRIITRLYKIGDVEKYPAGLKFCIQHLYWWHEYWIELVRIDNYLHQNKIGTHIHFFNKKQVEWRELSFQEARIKAEKLAKRIMELMEGKQDGED